MLGKGFSLVTDYREAMIQAIDSGDEMALLQLKEELSNDALEIVLRGMSHEYQVSFN